VSLAPYLVAWRTIPLHDREVVDALVDPGHAAPSPPLAAALRDWPGTYYWSDEPDGRHLVLTRKTGTPTRESWPLHAFLAVITLYTTTVAGAMIAGALSPDTGFGVAALAGGRAYLRDWSAGLSFSLPLFAILLCHELGHYLTARRYQLDVSPPYFLPGPPPVPPLPGIGTLGAFIRLRTLLTDRRQLLDVGAAGPFAGFLVALPVLAIGLSMSHALPIGSSMAQGMVLLVGGMEVTPLGDSLITLLTRQLIVPDAGTAAIGLHPTAFAGWVGMFVTMLNLLPMGQLDGGHILFAALPRWHRRVAIGFWVCVILLGALWRGWLFWGFIVLLLSRGRLAHPPVLDIYRPLPRSRILMAWASLVLFLLTFAPIPFRS
jgi:membrane-associated protease RseP (regulator of RpoE activity)